MTNLKNNNIGKQANNFAKYTGIAFQMLATIGLFTFIGYKIDAHQGEDKFTYAAIFGFLGVIASLYMIVRSLTRGNKK